MRPVIRKMTGNDREAVVNILRATVEFNELDFAIALEVIDSYLEDPEGSGYDIRVAEVDGGVAGYIACGATPLTVGTWDIYWIAVAPELKGKGTGTALLASTEESIGKAKGRLVLIETSGKPEYEDTRRFYKKRGYREVSRIRDYYAVGDDKIILEKRFR
ncbi:MAG: GNAT family N-acetyltransferase [Chloroflexota bacterium]